MGSCVHLGPQPSLVWWGHGPSPCLSVTDRVAGRVSSGWQRGPALQTLNAPSPALLPGSCTPTPETGWWSPPGSCAPGVPASPTLCPLCPLCKPSPPASFQSHVLDPKPAHLLVPIMGTSEGRDHLEFSPEGHWVSDGLLLGLARGGTRLPMSAITGLVSLWPTPPLVPVSDALVFRKASKLN